MMTLLFFDGFSHDTNLVTQWKPEWSTLSAVIDTGGRNSPNAFRPTGNCKLTLPASAQMFMGMAVSNITQSTNGGAIQFMGDGGTTTHITVNTYANGLLEVRRGGSAGTLLVSVTTDQYVGVWHHLQIKVKVDDSAGEVIVKWNGVEIVNFAGDTRNAGTSTNLDAIQWSILVNNQNLYDDLWVANSVDATATQGRPNNTFLGDLAVRRHAVDSDGAVVNEWSVTGAATHWQAVDDAINSTNSTDYINVSNTTLPKRDLVGIQNYSGTVTAVYGLQSTLTAQKTDAGTANVQHLIRESGGTVTAGPTKNLSTTWMRYFSPFYWVKPSDSTVFTSSDVDGLQIGVDAVT